MSKTVTEKLGKMQIKVSDVEEKKTTLETNAKELVKQIQIKEQEIINLKTDLVRLQGAIAMCTDLMQSTENPDA
jgi:hypothetical protein